MILTYTLFYNQLWYPQIVSPVQVAVNQFLAAHDNTSYYSKTKGYFFVVAMFFFCFFVFVVAFISFFFSIKTFMTAIVSYTSYTLCISINCVVFLIDDILVHVEVVVLLVHVVKVVVVLVVVVVVKVVGNVSNNTFKIKYH